MSSAEDLANLYFIRSAAHKGLNRLDLAAADSRKDPPHSSLIALIMDSFVVCVAEMSLNLFEQHPLVGRLSFGGESDTNLPLTTIASD